MIRITAKKEGFRRCGMAHSAQPVDHPSDKFAPEQVEEMKADPMLIVETVPDPEKKDPKKDGGKGKGK